MSSLNLLNNIVGILILVLWLYKVYLHNIINTNKKENLFKIYYYLFTRFQLVTLVKYNLPYFKRNRTKAKDLSLLFNRYNLSVFLIYLFGLIIAIIETYM